MSFAWNRYRTSSGFVSFQEIGDAVEGEVLSIDEGKDYNGNPCPELKIETDEGTRTLTAGQTVLQSALAEKAPDVGDFIKITYTGTGEAKKGKNPPKLFEVEVTRVADRVAVTAEDLGI